MQKHVYPNIVLCRLCVLYILTILLLDIQIGMTGRLLLPMHSGLQLHTTDVGQFHENQNPFLSSDQRELNRKM